MINRTPRTAAEGQRQWEHASHFYPRGCNCPLCRAIAISRQEKEQEEVTA